MLQAENSDQTGLISLLGHPRTGGLANSAIAIVADFIGTAAVPAADSSAADTPAPDTPPGTSFDNSAAHAKLADALTADYGSNGGPPSDDATSGRVLDSAPFSTAPSAGPEGGDGWGHVLAGDDCFW